MTAKSKFSYFALATSGEAVRRGSFPRAVARRLIIPFSACRVVRFDVSRLLQRVRWLGDGARVPDEHDGRLFRGHQPRGVRQLADDVERRVHGVRRLFRDAPHLYAWPF